MIDRRFEKWLPNGLRYLPRCVDLGEAVQPEKMIRRRKLLEIAAESPASGARFVGLRAILLDSLTCKRTARKKTDEIIARNFDFDNNPKMQTANKT